MEVKGNLNADVTFLGQKIVASGHVTLRLPNNPITIARCLREQHSDDCSLKDHIDVVDLDLDFEVQ